MKIGGTNIVQAVLDEIDGDGSDGVGGFHGFSLLSDEVDEAREDDARLVTRSGVLDDGVGDASRGRTSAERVEVVVGVDDRFVGANHILLGIAGVGTDEVPILTPRSIGGAPRRRIRLVGAVLESLEVILRHSLGVEQEEPDDIRLGTVAEDTQERIGRAGVGVLVHLTSLRVDDVTLGVVVRIAARQRVARRLAIGEDDRVDDLHLVLTLELGNDFHCANDCLVKRSAAEAVLRRSVSVERGTRRRSVPEEVESLLELSRLHLGGEEVDEAERHKVRVLDVGSNLGLRPLCRGFDCFGTPQILRARKVVLDVGTRRERIDLERNANLLAEEDELDELLDGVHQHGLHGRRPVDEHHQAVVLAVLNDGVTAEDVVVDLVVDHANGVEDARAGNRSALGGISSLTHLELLDHVVDGRSTLGDELREVLAGRSKTIHAGLVVVHRLLHGAEVLLNVRHDILIRMHDVLDVGNVEHAGRGSTSRALELLLHILIESALSTRSRGEVGGLRRTLRSSSTIALAVGLALLVTLALGLLVTIVVAVVAIASTISILRFTITTAAVGAVLVAIGVGFDVDLSATVLRHVGHIDALVAAVGEQVGRDDSDFIERLSVLNAVNEHLLLSSEVHGLEVAELEVNVDAVDERERVDILALEAEEVVVRELAVRSREVTTKTGELVLDEPFDAGILNDIQVVHRNTTRGGATDVERGRDALDGLVTLSPRSEERMTDLVTDEHIVDALVHVLPLRESENAIASVERRRVSLRVVLHGEVLTGEKACEDVLGSDV